MSEPTPSLTERQRQHIVDAVYKATIANAEKAADPPDPSGTGEFVHIAAEHYAKAMLSGTQAFMTATAPRSRR